MTQETETEIVSLSALESMERVQIDVQITTAKRYPRVLSSVKKAMLEFATLDEETAASCFYTLPRQGKSIQGPSARMAEIALSCFQNIKAGARIIGNDGKTITAQGVCHDLQNNVCVSVEVKRRITDKGGRTYNDDMQVVTGNAACSIALRNATFKVVPAALVKPIYEAAKRVAVGDAKTLSDRRAKCVDAFAKMGVSKEKLLAKLERKAVEDISLDDLETLIGLHTAIKEGDATIDESFAEAKASAPEPQFSRPAAKLPDESDQVPGVEVPPGVAPVNTQATPQAELAMLLNSSGVAFDDFTDWLKTTGRFADADSLATLDDLPAAVAVAVMQDTKGLSKCVTLYGKKGAAK